jgi:hypothetical protein
MAICLHTKQTDMSGAQKSWGMERQETSKIRRYIGLNYTVFKVRSQGIGDFLFFFYCDFLFLLYSSCLFLFFPSSVSEKRWTGLESAQSTK